MCPLHLEMLVTTPPAPLTLMTQGIGGHEFLTFVMVNIGIPLFI